MSTDAVVDDLQPEYKFDYSKARPNRFAKRMSEDSVMVELDPDVAQVFTSAEAVNAILRAIIQNMPNVTIQEGVGQIAWQKGVSIETLVNLWIQEKVKERTVEDFSSLRRNNLMNMAVKPLEELIRELPPALRVEVCDFVEFLLAKRVQPRKRKLRQDWAGTLRNYPQQYTSLELQHVAPKWREE